ncbi:MAG: hypothetical protein LBH98_01815 [Chitinispirillales bacterium]|jgi:hypothetical protein|nr:hypothetical protein [Chitinispirillales bacterium]
MKNSKNTNKKFTEKKFTENSYPLISLMAALFIYGCATQETPAPSSATIDYYFSYDTSFAENAEVKFSTGNADWTIEKAGMIAGEIGIHWEEANTPRSADPICASLRHDVPGGKISPKIYGYFAVDLLKPQHIQMLKVEPGIYSHIHMVITNENNANALGSSVTRIDSFPELKQNRSYYVSGKVSKDEKEYPFELYTTQTFDENTMGDMMFRIQIFENELYSFFVSPKLQSWFSPIVFETLKPNENGIVLINDENNYSAAYAFRQKFTDSNPMALAIKKQL